MNTQTKKQSRVIQFIVRRTQLTFFFSSTKTFLRRDLRTSHAEIHLQRTEEIRKGTLSSDIRSFDEAEIREKDQSSLKSTDGGCRGKKEAVGRPRRHFSPGEVRRTSIERGKNSVERKEIFVGSESDLLKEVSSQLIC